MVCRVVRWFSKPLPPGLHPCMIPSPWPWSRGGVLNMIDFSPHARFATWQRWKHSAAALGPQINLLLSSHEGRFSWGAEPSQTSPLSLGPSWVTDLKHQGDFALPLRSGYCLSGSSVSLFTPLRLHDKPPTSCPGAVGHCFPLPGPNRCHPGFPFLLLLYSLIVVPMVILVTLSPSLLFPRVSAGPPLGLKGGVLRKVSG